MGGDADGSQTEPARVLGFDGEPRKENEVFSVFLDANILLDLWKDAEERAAGRQGQRGKLAGFMTRSRGICRLFTTPSALEEVFHILSSRALRDPIRIRSCHDAKELRRKHRGEYVAAQGKGIAGFLSLLKALRGHAVELRAPVIPADSDTLAAKVVEAFVAVLRAAPELGGRDAMHVVTARLMNCTRFASKDGDFRFVPEAVVYCENPHSHVR